MFSNPDVVSENSIKETVKKVEDIVGEKGLNCLINNAGINVLGSLEDVTTEAMLRTFETNTVAQLMLSKVRTKSVNLASDLVQHMSCVGATHGLIWCNTCPTCL